MPPITIRSPPSLDDYTPLAEHESRTPETFFGGKPVLYYHAAGVKAWIPASQRGSGLPFFTADSTAAAPSGPEAASLNGTAEELIEQVVDLFVTTQSFTLFSPSAECGLSIPYPSITLHAIKHLDSSPTAGAQLSAIYLQLELSGNSDPDDEDFDTTELTLLPPPSPASSAAPAPADGEAATPTAAAAQTESRKLFDAISACSNLHPDPTLVNSDSSSDATAAAGDNAGGAVFANDDRIVFEGDGTRITTTAFPGLGGVVLRGATDGGPAAADARQLWVDHGRQHAPVL